MSRPDPLIGVTVGSYRIERLIGAGGMGRVYEALHPEIGAIVAVKVLVSSAATDPDLVERFFAEARAVNLIRHERIVSITDFGRLGDGRPYIVMERLQGAPLSRIMRVSGPLPLGTLARLAGEVLEGLAAAHSHQVVHRDLKPDNVFVTQSGNAKLLDFGIAKLAPDFHGRPAETHASMLLGAPPYVSPEHAAGDPTDTRADLYSLGIVLYQASTGRLPFDGNGLFEILRQHIEDAPGLPSLLRPDMPRPYEEVILRALAKKPDDRFATAEAMAAALASAARTLPAAAFAPVDIATAAALPQVTGPVAAPSAPPTAVTVPGRRDSAPPPISSSPTNPPITPPAAPRARGRTWAVALALVVLLGGGTATLLALNNGSSEQTSSITDAGSDGSVALAAVRSDAAVPSPAAMDGAPTAAAVVAIDAAVPTTTASSVSGDKPDSITEPPDSQITDPGAKIDAGTAPPDNQGGDQTGAEGEPSTQPAATSAKTPRPGNFDAGRYFQTARRLARGLASDAELTMMRVEGVRIDGTVDLTRTNPPRIAYHFASKEMRDRDDDWCMVVVTVNAKQAQASVAKDSGRCRGQSTYFPKCALSKMMAQAEKDGAPTKELFLVNFLGTWGIRGGEFGKAYPDKCD